jgi:hypothetical protein
MPGRRGRKNTHQTFRTHSLFSIIAKGKSAWKRCVEEAAEYRSRAKSFFSGNSQPMTGGMTPKGGWVRALRRLPLRVDPCRCAYHATDREVMLKALSVNTDDCDRRPPRRLRFEATCFSKLLHPAITI